MTLNDIIYSALVQLERGTDAQTVDKYRDVFRDYANTALFEIANRVKPTHIAAIELDEEGRFNASNLPRQCMSIDSISSASGTAMSWNEIETGVIEVVNGALQTVSVSYRYIPNDLTSPNDVPQLPEYMHRAIPYYIVACNNQNTGKDTAVDYFSLFNRQITLIRNNMHYGDTSKDKLINMGW